MGLFRLIVIDYILNVVRWALFIFIAHQYTQSKLDLIEVYCSNNINILAF